MVRVLAELGANVETPTNDGCTPVYFASYNGHAEVVRVLAELGASVTTTENNGWSPLSIAVRNAHLEACRTLLLLGAPVTIRDLKHYANSAGDTRQLRADLQAWARDALAQHRIFLHFLCGCSSGGSALELLGGETGITEQIGHFVGIVVGTELQHLRALGPAFAAVDWPAHDEP